MYNPLSFDDTFNPVSVSNFTSSNIKYDTISFLTLTGYVIVQENNNIYTFGNVKIVRSNTYNEKDELWWIRTINFNSAVRIN